MSGSNEENVRHISSPTTSESGYRLSRFARCLACGARLVRLPVSSNYSYQPESAMQPPGNQPEKEYPGLILISEQATRIAKHSNAKLTVSTSNSFCNLPIGQSGPPTFTSWHSSALVNTASKPFCSLAFGRDQLLLWGLPLVVPSQAQSLHYQHGRPTPKPSQERK